MTTVADMEAWQREPCYGLSSVTPHESGTRVEDCPECPQQGAPEIRQWLQDYREEVAKFWEAFGEAFKRERLAGEIERWENEGGHGHAPGDDAACFEAVIEAARRERVRADPHAILTPEFPAFPPGIVGIPHKSHYVVLDLLAKPRCRRGHLHDSPSEARACDALPGADTENAPTSTGSIDTGT